MIGRIGGATRSAAMGLSAYDIQQQRRWKRDAVGMNIRDGRKISREGLTDVGVECQGKAGRTRTSLLCFGGKGKYMTGNMM